VEQVGSFVRHAALAEDICDRVVPLRLFGASLRNRAALLAQMNAAQVIREIRCGQAQDLVNEAHAGKYRTSPPARSRPLRVLFHTEEALMETL
jgi:hypothetical protein